ncbi:dTMP kinase [Marinicrinis lubricantis]|uniref:Thymidylate kinase n=1 Tax=Marinicrinis lubricantis TaxID=2086470 RepID=A0ABW1IQF2_9BACL
MFITFEGGEGAGKSSIIPSVKTWFESKGKQVMITREPGGIDISEKIRGIILDPDHVHMDSRTEALLYAAARRQHLVEKVVPALQSGIVVLCDRFIDSSLAYQGYARGIGFDEIMNINAFAIDRWMPDLTIYLDVDPKTGMERIHANKDREINRLDMEALSFHDKVREGYLAVAARYPERIQRIDANPPLSIVIQSVQEVLNHFMKKRMME